MRKLTLFILVLAVTAGCRDGQFIKNGFTSTSCGGGGISLTGYTVTAIRYGDSRLRIIPVSKLRPESEFRFGLLPKVKDSDPPVNFRDAFVTISSDDDDGDTPANWLDVSGTMSGSGGSLVVCVPAETGLAKTQYKYAVTVSWPGTATTDTLGYLDPRARIILD